MGRLPARQLSPVSSSTALAMLGKKADCMRVYAHRPMLGTFHCKFMVVDRKMAILCSNNIQDRPNMEMMCHLEGPIVDSIYDTALISWHKAMNPPLPRLSHPYQPPEGGYKFGMENEYATTHILDGSKGEEIFKSLKEKGEQARDEDQSKTTEEAKGDGRVFIAGKYETITDHISEHPRIHLPPPRADTYSRCRRPNHAGDHRARPLARVHAARPARPA